MYALCSPRSGNPVPNQFVETIGTCQYFISYKSVIAKFDFHNKTLTLGRDWDFSRTTQKYLKVFIDENTPFRYESAEHVRQMLAGGCFIYDKDMKDISILERR